MDGAGRRASFWHITLPLLKPTSFFVLIVSTVTAVAGQQAFDLVYVMTKGGPMFRTEVLVYYIYYQGFTVYNMGYASAMAFFLFLIVLFFTVFQLKGFSRAESNLEG